MEGVGSILARTGIGRTRAPGTVHKWRKFGDIVWSVESGEPLMIIRWVMAGCWEALVLTDYDDLSPRDRFGHWMDDELADTPK